MPRRTKSVPSYRLHKASGQAVVTLDGKDFYLGGYQSPESHAEYRRLVAEWLATHRQPPTSPDQRAPDLDRTDLTINELFVAFWRFVESYYIKNGQPTKEQQALRYAIAPVVELYGDTQAGDFGPGRLKAVRQKMIDTGWCRSLINARINRVRRMFKWGVENEMVPSNTLHALRAVAPLKRNRHNVRESDPIKPVPEDRVEAVLPHASPQVAAMIRLQMFTGMRPGEVVIMRGCDLDTSGRLWTYTPASHKTEHHGRQREIYLGPKAQQVLKPWLKEEPEAYLFSPAEAEAHRRQQQHARRHTPASCGNRPGTNRRTRRRKQPAERYTVTSYGRAIADACRKAFPPPQKLARGRVSATGRKAKSTRLETDAEWRRRLGEEQWAELQQWRREHRWSPNQLRHNAATYLRKQFGIEAARVVLGHSSAAVTEVYAELDLEKARRIMEQIG